MDRKKIDDQIIKVNNLYQFRNLSPEEKIRVAYERVVLREANLDKLFFDKKERIIAKSLMKKYLEDFMPETTSELNTLKNVLYLEVINSRLQKKMGKNVDVKEIEVLHRNINQINSLKKELGIIGKDENSTVEKKITALMKKFAVWRRNNQATRQFVCPYCGQMVLLKIRKEKWEEQRHPFFKDRILYNRHLVRLYLEGKLTKEDVAKVLETSPDYIDWLIKKWKTNPEWEVLTKGIKMTERKDD